MLYETNRHEKLTDKLRIDFLELPKAKKHKTNDKLQDWLDFLNVTTEEGLDMSEKNTINPTVMTKAIAVVRQMSADEKLFRDIQRREETIMNERSALNSARKQGIQQERENTILILKKLGYTDEEIKNILESI